nr:MAG TPA: hypothetical protein [Caudoviricetes sp.]
MGRRFLLSGHCPAPWLGRMPSEIWRAVTRPSVRSSILTAWTTLKPPPSRHFCTATLLTPTALLKRFLLPMMEIAVSIAWFI